MERNQNDNLDSGTLGGSATGTGAASGNLESGFQASGAGDTGGFGGTSGLGNSGSQGYGAGIGGSSGGTGSIGSDQSFGDRSKGGLGGAREKASELKATLADKLEAGAQKLRSKQGGGELAGAGSYGGANVGAESGRMGQVNDKLAQGMQSTAEFIRNADVDSVKQGIEKQVRENPGRTLLIAAGIGYLLGKAFRK